MSTLSTIEIKNRPFSQTKGEINMLRHNGLVPCVIYGKNEDSSCFSITLKDFLKEIYTPGIYSRVFALSNGKKALIKDIQFHPVTDIPLHVDFYALQEGSSVSVNVVLNLINQDKSPGLKRGGVINMVSHFVTLLVPIDDIPNNITIDLTGLEIGRSIHFNELAIPANAKAVNVKDDDTIITIVAPSGLVSAAEEEKQ